MYEQNSKESVSVDPIIFKNRRYETDISVDRLDNMKTVKSIDDHIIVNKGKPDMFRVEEEENGSIYSFIKHEDIENLLFKDISLLSSCFDTRFINCYFDNVLFSIRLDATVFENCTFNNCKFTRISINESEFISCDFIDMTVELTQLSEVTLSESTLQTVDFKSSLMDSVAFDQVLMVDTKMKHTIMDSCSLDNIRFENCEMDYDNHVNVTVQHAIYDRTKVPDVYMMPESYNRAEVVIRSSINKE